MLLYDLIFRCTFFCICIEVLSFFYDITVYHPLLCQCGDVSVWWGVGWVCRHCILEQSVICHVEHPLQFHDGIPTDTYSSQESRFLKTTRSLSISIISQVKVLWHFTFFNYEEVQKGIWGYNEIRMIILRNTFESKQHGNMALK